MFEKEIAYWNAQYRFYSSDIYEGKSFDKGVLAAMERMDAVFSGDNVIENIDLAGLYLNILLRPRTSFLALCGTDKSDNPDFEKLAGIKLLIDSVTKLYHDFDMDKIVDSSDQTLTRNVILDELNTLESHQIDNMSLDDLRSTFSQIADFFDTEGSLMLGNRVERDWQHMPYQAAVIFLEEKGFEAPAAYIEHTCVSNSIPEVSVDEVLDSIVDSLEELDELGYNKHEFA